MGFTLLSYYITEIICQNMYKYEILQIVVIFCAVPAAVICVLMYACQVCRCFNNDDNNGKKGTKASMIHM